MEGHPNLKLLARSQPVVRRTNKQEKEARAEERKVEAAEAALAEAKKRLATLRAEKVVADKLSEDTGRELLGDKAFAAATVLVNKVLAGTIEPRPQDIPALLNALVNLGRLEAGESTANTEHQLSREERLAVIRQIKAEAERQLKTGTSGADAG